MIMDTLKLAALVGTGVVLGFYLRTHLYAAWRKHIQRIGITKAKAAGKYKGGQPIRAEKVQKLKELIDDGASISAASREVGISRVTAYKYLKEEAIK